MRNKNRRRGGIIATALVLLALAASPAAYGQSNGQSDGFFSNADGVRDGDNYFSGTGSWLGLGDDFGGSSTWDGFDNGDVPLGGGLLVLALSGVCYAGAKKVKRLRLKD